MPSLDFPYTEEGMALYRETKTKLAAIGGGSPSKKKGNPRSHNPGSHNPGSNRNPSYASRGKISYV